MPTADADTAALVIALGDALGTAVRPERLDAEVRSAVSSLRRLFGAAACSFARVEPDGATLRFVAADGAGASEIQGVSLPVSRGIVGWVAMSGEPIRIADVSADRRFAADVATSTRYVPTTILAAPVVDTEGEVAGVVEVLDPTVEHGDSGQDLAVLGLVASQLATIVRLSALYDALGTGLVRTLVDPGATGVFDEALGSVADPEAGAALRAVAQAFRSLAGGGPAAARLAEGVLTQIADYTASQQTRPGRR